ncbi:MAG: 16S rRNA (guanine(966)-N(2))-methyltransferase RsmD [Pseudohongiella sp.]|uniref:16S rRNA (guanine(966)-N(2))-methyltransferase RsmD n=1 Tax=Pseudohongiella sp. TaxID=1979412 RepID=UPI00349FED91
MPRKTPGNKAATGQRNTLRIIGGQWRGRKLQFPDVPGLRPTADRVRETLFNWLQGWVLDENCLDMFAGSGACGLEALSRGARSAVFVDASRDASASIQAHLALLGAENASVVTAKAEQWLATNTANSVSGLAGKFGLVFLDPPFADQILPDIALQLESSGILKPRAQIYLEAGQDLAALPLPANWTARKNLRAGAVYYGLYERRA